MKINKINNNNDMILKENIKIHFNNSWLYSVLIKTFNCSFILNITVIFIIIKYNKIVLLLVIPIIYFILFLYIAFLYSDYISISTEPYQFIKLLKQNKLNNENIISIRQIKIKNKFNRMILWVEGIEIDIIGKKRILLFEQYKIMEIFRMFVDNNNYYTITKWILNNGIDKEKIIDKNIIRNKIEKLKYDKIE